MLNEYYSDAGMTLYLGDVLDVLGDLPDESVQMVVTSPPYWGLRDYGTATWVGGDAECDHKKPGATKTFGNPVFNENRPSREATDTVGYRDICGKCGAQRVDKQLGLEPTPAAYVANMVAVFREVRRVLQTTGTCWLNLGDCYVSGGWFDPYRRTTSGKLMPPQGRAPRVDGLKSKDLVGIPWRVAFALQADGWWLRSDIIWSKPNPMPESVTDRPTKSHEYLFLLTKSSRYAYDADAIREPHQERQWMMWDDRKAAGEFDDNRHEITLDSGQYRFKHGAGFKPGEGGRNKRSVWTVATHALKEAHFATFPPKLIEPCILAGSREGDVVLDPFLGSGTTALVAQKHGRRCIGIDISADYLDLAIRRNAQKTLWFAEEAS